MPTVYDESKVYDDEKADSRRHPGQVAADDQKQAARRDEIRNLEDQFSAPGIADKDRNTSGIKEKESNVAAPYSKNQEKEPPEQPEKLREKIKSKFQGMSTRRKAGYGIALGGTGILLLITTLLTSTYRIPSLLGGIEDNTNSSRVVRLIVERRIERMVVEWQIQKKLGQLDDERYVKKEQYDGQALWRI